MLGFAYVRLSDSQMVLRMCEIALTQSGLCVLNVRL
jgi:hypothetical protein